MWRWGPLLRGGPGSGLNGDLVAVIKVEVAIHVDMFFPLSLDRKEG